MTERHEHRVSHSDLTLLAFTCKHCKAELTLDFRNEEQRRRLLDPLMHALRCPFCDVEFDRSFQKSFQCYSEWRQRLEDSGHEIIFRLPDAQQGTG
jgi:hypothetical protein